MGGAFSGSDENRGDFSAPFNVASEQEVIRGGDCWADESNQRVNREEKGEGDCT